MRLGDAIAATAVALLAAPASGESAKSVDDCVSIAVAGSGLVREAEGKVQEWQGRLQEVESVFYPKVMALTYLAPTFEMRGNALQEDVVRNYDHWGPLFHLEGMIAQPFYTFGQAAAGRRAASARLKVEEGRLAQTRDAVALEVHRYYWLHLYVKSIGPTLSFAHKTLAEAQKKAREDYEEGNGKVTNVDLMKLAYASTELEKYRVQAEVGLPLSLSALKHTMGLPDTATLALAEETLPELSAAEPAPLGELVQQAFKSRPEALQLQHGKEAALSLEEAESLAMFPVALIAGQLTVGWSPMRDDEKNPYRYDPWNDVSGGVALALKWDFDPAKTLARTESARGLVAQTEGLAHFAATGIPLEVRKARDDVVQSRRLTRLADEGSAAARKWMVFAAAAWTTGTGETRDLLEGLAAFVTSRKGYFDNLLTAHMAQAQLSWAVGAVAQQPRGVPGQGQ